MNVVFIGIDPGVSGAAGLISCHERHVTCTVQDLPVTMTTFLANQSKSLDIPAFITLVQDYTACNFDYVVLATEQMQSMGFKTPARTLTMLAEMAGSIEAVVRTVCYYKKVPLFIRKFQPKVWTHWMFPESEGRVNRKSEAKNESLEKAQTLFQNTDVSSCLRLKKHHDRAEAMLLAFTALAEMQGCVVDPKLKLVGNLADVYLSHKQSTEDQTAKITDILNQNLLPKGVLCDEINRRKNK